MIRVTVTFVPGGNEDAAREIARGLIVNDGTGTRMHGNYDCMFRYATPDTKPVYRRIEGWYRGRGVWGLIRAALNSEDDK